MELTKYRATDRRVYDGYPCTDMQREWNHTDALEQRMRELDRTACCTRFPMEEKYLVFVNANIFENPDLKGPPRELTGNMWAEEQDALIEAIMALEARA